jgi:hypothetical protein
VGFHSTNQRSEDGEISRTYGVQSEETMSDNYIYDPSKYKPSPYEGKSTSQIIFGTIIAHPFLSFFIFILLLSRLGCGGGSGSSNPNEGYMSYQDNRILTDLAIKEGYGKYLTSDERNFLEKAKKGKLGKPYDQRPDKTKP